MCWEAILSSAPNIHSSANFCLKKMTKYLANQLDRKILAEMCELVSTLRKILYLAFLISQPVKCSFVEKNIQNVRLYAYIYFCMNSFRKIYVDSQSAQGKNTYILLFKAFIFELAPFINLHTWPYCISHSNKRCKIASHSFIKVALTFVNLSDQVNNEITCQRI